MGLGRGRECWLVVVGIVVIFGVWGFLKLGVRVLGMLVGLRGVVYEFSRLCVNVVFVDVRVFRGRFF